MIDFLKNVIKRLKYKSDNEEANKLNKIIYTAILVCAFIFICTIIYILIKNIPNFADSIQYEWNNSKKLLNNL